MAAKHGPRRLPGWPEAQRDRWRTDPKLLEAAVARSGLVAAHIERVVVGQSHEVYRASSGSGQMVAVRVAHRDSGVEVEAAVIERVRSMGVPVPEVLWWETLDQRVRATGLMVQRWAPGERLDELARTSSRAATELMVDLGRWLAISHQVAVDGFGKLDAGFNGANGSYAEWFVDLLVDSQLGEVKAAVEGDRVARDMADQAACLIVAHRSLVEAQVPRLAHGDFSPANVLVVDGRISAVLDWEGAMGAPRANDFAWWASIAEGPISTIEPLMRGYSSELGEAVDLGLMYLLAQARILVGLLYFSARAADQIGYTTARRRLRLVLRELSSEQY